MTTTFTLIDNIYSANVSPNRKQIFGTVSVLRPVTAGGDSISLSTYFPSKFLGGKVMAIDPNVSIAGAGLLAQTHFRADTTSTASVLMQVFNVGVGANFGNLIDNTINVQAATATVVLIGY